MRVLRSLFEEEDISFFEQVCDGLKKDEKYIYFTKGDFAKVEEAVLNSPQLDAEERIHFLVLIKGVSLFYLAPNKTIQDKVNLMVLATEIYSIDKHVGLALLTELKVE